MTQAPAKRTAAMATVERTAATMAARGTAAATTPATMVEMMPPAAGRRTTGDAPDGGEDDHDDALRAVTAKDAIPLKQMLQQFEHQFDGTIVDVTLIRDTNSLRYG